MESNHEDLVHFPGAFAVHHHDVALARRYTIGTVVFTVLIFVACVIACARSARPGDGRRVTVGACRG